MKMVKKRILAFCQIFFPLHALFGMPLISALAMSEGWISQQRAILGQALCLIVFLVVVITLSRPRLGEWLYHPSRAASALWAVWLAALTQYFVNHLNPLRGSPYFTLSCAAVVTAVTVAFLTIIPAAKHARAAFLLSLCLFPGSLATLAGHRYLHFNDVPVASGAKGSGPKYVIHIIFDMFSASLAEGAPALREDIKALTEKYGLTFYANHHANASNTTYSLPSILQVDHQLPLNIALKNTTDDNNLMAHYHSRGYSVSIHGQAFPYCDVFSRWAHACSITPRRSTHTRFVKAAFALTLAEYHPKLPILAFDNEFSEMTYPTPEAILGMMDEYAAGLDSMARGKGHHYNYLHVLLPHLPAVLDESCQVRRAWQADDAPHAKPVDIATWQIDRYRSQSRCTLRKLTGILERLRTLGIYDEAMILIHSDHGLGTHIATVAARATSLASKEITELSQVVAWTKAPGQRAALRVEDLTTNRDVSRFLTEPNMQRIPASSNALFRYEVEPGKLVSYATTNGREWKYVPPR